MIASRTRTGPRSRNWLNSSALMLPPPTASMKPKTSATSASLRATASPACAPAARPRTRRFPSADTPLASFACAPGPAHADEVHARPERTLASPPWFFAEDAGQRGPPIWLVPRTRCQIGARLRHRARGKPSSWRSLASSLVLGAHHVDEAGLAQRGAELLEAKVPAAVAVQAPEQLPPVLPAPSPIL